MMTMSKERYYYTENEIKELLKSAVVLCDSREQKNGHILAAFNRLKIAHKGMALSFGDYSIALPARPEAGIIRDMYFDKAIMIERKNSLDELAGCFTASRERFKDELIRGGTARKYLLVEDGPGYEAIFRHNYQSKLSEKSFLASLLSFQARYDLNVIFAEPERAGEIIWSLLYYHMRGWLLGEG